VADAQQGDVGGRRYGYWTGHFVVVASMIGAGILLSSGFTLKDTGNPTGLLAIWVLGGILALCGAVTVAELATALPRSGGDYIFVGQAYGQGAAFVSGWATFVVGFAAPTAVVARTALGYLFAPFNQQLTEQYGPSAPELAVQIGATVLVVVVAVVHTLGSRQSAWLQITATLIKISILVGIVVAGILFGKGDWNHLSAGHLPTEGEWPALAIGLIYVGYAYSGWNGAAYLAGEIKNPSKMLPRALIGGTATVILLYLLVNLTYIYALDPVWMQSLSYDTDFPKISRVAETAVDAMFGRDVANVFAVAVGLSLVASVSAYVLTGPRVAYAMARDGVFPGFASRVHPTRETPAFATWTQAALATALIWYGTFREVLDYTTVGLAVVSGLTVASIFPIRRRTDLSHPYKMPLYPLPPVLFLVLTAWTVGYAIYDEKSRWPALLSLLTVLVAIPLSRLMPAPKLDTTPPPQ
jgi:APA family basic amino acid/polyamine antiporter